METWRQPPDRKLCICSLQTFITGTRSDKIYIYVAGPIQIFSLDKRTRHGVDRPALEQESKLELSLPVIGNYTIAGSFFLMQSQDLFL